MTLSIMRWKLLPAFRRPNASTRNSYSPKGVMTAVLAMSSSLMGICQ